MMSALFTDSGIIPTQAPFGPHALLPDAEFRVVWKFLRCTQCCYRLLYHRFLIREYRESRENSSGRRTPRALPLHSLTRAIKTVLHGLSLNRHLSKKVVYASSIHSLTIQQEFTALVKTAFSVQSACAVCLAHARELFALLYLDNDDDSASFRSVFIPKGRSCFYQTKSSDDDDDDDTDERTDDEESETHTLSSPCRRLTLGTQHIVSTTFSSGSIELRAWSGTVSLNCEASSALPDLAKINSKWNSYYAVGKPVKAAASQTSRATRHVHFPPGQHISSTHRLITYALASQLERCNRIWENEARYRIFDRYRRLVCEGYDPSMASELANASTEDDDSGPNEDEDGPHASVQHVEEVSLNEPAAGSHKISQKKRRRQRKRASSARFTFVQTSSSVSWTSTQSNLSSFRTTKASFTGPPTKLTDSKLQA